VKLELGDHRFGHMVAVRARPYGERAIGRSAVLIAQGLPAELSPPASQAKFIPQCLAAQLKPSHRAHPGGGQWLGLLADQMLHRVKERLEQGDGGARSRAGGPPRSGPRRGSRNGSQPIPYWKSIWSGRIVVEALDLDRGRLPAELSGYSWAHAVKFIDYRA
jgi:hypothetical protein